MIGPDCIEVGYSANVVFLSSENGGRKPTQAMLWKKRRTCGCCEMSPPQNDFTTTLPNNIRFPKAQFANSNFLPQWSPGCSGAHAKLGCSESSTGLGGRNERFRAIWKFDVARQLTMESKKAWLEVPKGSDLSRILRLAFHSRKVSAVSQTWCLQNFSATLKWTAWTTWTIRTTNESLFDKCFHHAFYQEDTYPPLRWPLESSRPEPLLVLKTPQVDSPPPSQVSQIQHARLSHRVYPHHEYRESMRDRNPALCEVSARARRTWSLPLEQSGLVRVWLLGYFLHIQWQEIYKNIIMHIYIYKYRIYI